MGTNKTLAESATLLEKHINIIKYTLFCVNIIIWILGCFLLGMSIAVRLDTDLQQWIDALDISEYYIGLYILIFISLIILVVPFLSCASVYQEITQLLTVNAAGHGFCFLLVLVGCGMLMTNSSVNSGIQSSIRESMKRLIQNSLDSHNVVTLNMLQEEVGCCGADGPNDYLTLRKPLPNECRDTVTGNAYFHGCTDELTWFLEDKSSWIAGISFTLAFLHMLTTVLSYILIEALQKEEKMAYNKR